MGSKVVPPIDRGPLNPRKKSKHVKKAWFFKQNLFFNIYRSIYETEFDVKNVSSKVMPLFLLKCNEKMCNIQ